MLKIKLKKMVEAHGKSETLETLSKSLRDYQNAIRTAQNINQALDYEHELQDVQSMIKWLKSNGF